MVRAATPVTLHGVSRMWCGDCFGLSLVLAKKRTKPRALDPAVGSGHEVPGWSRKKWLCANRSSQTDHISVSWLRDGREASIGFFSQGFCHFQCKWIFGLINHYPELEFSEIGGSFFSSLFHLLRLPLSECRFVISTSSSGYKPAMDVKETYIVPVDLDLYSMLLLKRKKYSLEMWIIIFC